MKNNVTKLLIFGILIFTSCKKHKKNKIPEGAFPIVYEGHLYIKGSVNGIKGNYAFDTGASNLYLDDYHYSNNNFKYKNTSVGILPGVGTKPQRVTVIMDSVQFNLGGNLFKTNRVPVLKLKPILGDIADGILGIEYFNNSVLEINYEDKYMKIYSNIDSADMCGWDKIELTKKDNRLYIPLTVAVNDTINVSGNYLLDFGSGGTISFTSLISEEYNLIDNIDNKVSYFTKYGGVGGESSRYDFITSSVNIGNFKLKNVVMDFSLDKRGALASEKHLGVLGNEIYERFNVFIDFKNNILYIKPNKYYDDLFEPTKLGFSYIDRVQTLKSWIVTGLYSSLNADNAGLKIDDKILTINKVNVSDIDHELQESFFNDIDEVNLKIERNGKFIEINFKLEPIITTANN
jgi:hypothetical protein